MGTIRKIKEKRLKAGLDELNRLLGRPTEHWQEVNGKFLANVGNIFVEQRANGWYWLSEIVNTSGAISQSAWEGYQRFRIDQMIAVVNIVITAVRLGKAQASAEARKGQANAE